MARAPGHSTLLFTAGLLLVGCFAGRDGGAGGRGDPTRDAALGDADVGFDAGLDAGAAPPPDAAADVVHKGTRVEPNPPVCTDPDSREPRAERAKATTVGLQESLTDRCDEDGNLIDHQCEILASTDCEPCQGECSSCAEHTGRVIEVPFDCNGACVDGACVSWCADPGDDLVVSNDAGLLHIDNLTKARSYTCMPHADDQVHCFDLDGYVAEQVYTTGMDCYGDVPGFLLLAWDLAPIGHTMCFAECTQITE